MKKLLTVLALTLLTVIMAVTVAGCGGTDTSAIDELTERIEALEKENEDIKNKNNNLQNRVSNLNVFWTDKKEYSQSETMTVYFRQTAVIKIRIELEDISVSALQWSGKSVLNNGLYITSLSSNIYSDSIVVTSFVAWDNGTCVRNQSTSASILTKNVEKLVGGNYQATSDVYNNATWYDLVICVPGTPFELARFKNVTVKK